MITSKNTIEELAARLRQTAPYRLTFKKYKLGDADALCQLAKNTGSVFETYEVGAKAYYHISDPLCRMLEEAGMNK